MQILEYLIRYCETLISGCDKECSPLCRIIRYLMYLIMRGKFRCVMTKKSQNLVEFLFVILLLVPITLVIFEVALFWQDVNAIYNLNAEINANAALLDYSNLTLGSICPAADDTIIDGKPKVPKSAINILKAKDSGISLYSPDYTKTVTNGTEPFALYLFSGGGNITSSTVQGVTETSPAIQLWVDCRNPFEDGVTTQIEFYHKTIIISATIPRLNQGPPITIIPDKILIASPKLNTIRHY